MMVGCARSEVPTRSGRRAGRVTCNSRLSPIWRCSVLKKPLEAAPSALECVSCAAGFFVPSRHHLAAGFAMLVLAGAERGGVLSIALAIGRQQLGSLPLSLARSLSLSLSLSQSTLGSGWGGGWWGEKTICTVWSGKRKLCTEKKKCGGGGGGGRKPS